VALCTRCHFGLDATARFAATLQRTFTLSSRHFPLEFVPLCKHLLLLLLLFALGHDCIRRAPAAILAVVTSK